MSIASATPRANVRIYVCGGQFVISHNDALNIETRPFSTIIEGMQGLSHLSQLLNLFVNVSPALSAFSLLSLFFREISCQDFTQSKKNSAIVLTRGCGCFGWRIVPLAPTDTTTHIIRRRYANREQPSKKKKHTHKHLYNTSEGPVSVFETEKQWRTTLAHVPAFG